MAEAKYDVLTIGNAIVDVLAHAEEDFLVREGLVKGSMRLIDGKEADRLYEHMGTAQLISGGCAGNTAAGVASRHPGPCRRGMLTFCNRTGSENLTLAIPSPYGVLCRHGNPGGPTTRHLGTHTTRSPSLYWGA